MNKDPALTHKTSLLVRADSGREAIDLLVTGCVTEEPSIALASQIAIARQVEPTADSLLQVTA